jgi:hypothetical protein
VTVLKRLENVLFRNGVRRGLVGGNRAWTAVAVAVGGARLLRRLGGSGDGVVYREELKPGEAILISHQEG